MAISWALTPPSGVETTYDITASTNVRDVSDMLDAVYVADTPLVNKIGFGSPATNTIIEWITDNIGYGYIITSAAIASNASSFVCMTSGLGAASLALRQIHTGTVLKYNGFTDKSKGYLVVEDLSLGGGSVTFVFMSGTTQAGTAVSAGGTLFIVGSPAPEGSTPRQDSTRPRTICSNKTQIFRQDVRMTGTRTAIQMYAVADELRHQIMLRTKEYKRELERSVILGFKDAGTGGSSGETQTMGGIYDFLRGQSGSHIDTTSTTLTESVINAINAEMYNKGGQCNAIVVGAGRQQDISTWNIARLRYEEDNRMAGTYVNKYLFDLGNVADVLVSRWVPGNFAFLLDTPKLKIRPLTGRKFILEKLGLKGDYVEYQLISEVSLEFKGYNLAQHGMCTALT